MEPPTHWTTGAALLARQQAAEADGEPWSWRALRGRIAHTWGQATSARATIAAPLMLHAQHHGALVAWVTSTRAIPYAPDLEAMGLDLDAIILVRLRSDEDALIAAERLMRSGAIGVMVVEVAQCSARTWGRRQPRIRRLQGLAEHHGACVIIGARRRIALGPLVAVEARVTRARTTAGVCLELEFIKDKRAARAARLVQEVVDDPLGLCVRALHGAAVVDARARDSARRGDHRRAQRRDAQPHHRAQPGRAPRAPAPEHAAARGARPRR